MKLNVNMDMITKNVKHGESNTKIVSAVLNTNIKDDLIEYNCLCCNVAIRITRKRLMKT